MYFCTRVLWFKRVKAESILYTGNPNYEVPGERDGWTTETRPCRAS